MNYECALQYGQQLSRIIKKINDIVLIKLIYILSYFSQKRCTIKQKGGHLIDIENTQHSSRSVYNI